ncbi:MAG TPA: TldD/PmbA family protein [Cyanobacteria bacterium UBA11149]|nr:TldD/PmbA family protein [Cyanobacteria bacterium UBA11366]HBK63311.1 TldD/PmbA family protein [Cyanobacteria bacterium UBA11166]HBR76753.1 TldD/PmbA family protein [Cyanobacteria bacterium UBA11159]HBS68402.1 TldD/PmbA family protein [Cyanobacteria bacterium UBA11153]HBW92142.1 TldD/PmbA family protein [Cyanobacteria bacterium UBA11149]HCA95143.1 TldD/PmbA family protein [Cyanobacteria bacterium UBA9226]
MVQAPAPITTTNDLATFAIDLIRQAGCEYGDVRFCTYRQQNLFARDRSLSQLADNVSAGFGVRVLLDGAWGFASSPHKTAAEVERIVKLAVEIAKGSRLSQKNRVRLVPVAAYRDTYITPIAIDPFAIAITEKADLLLEINDKLMSYGERGIKKAQSYLRFTKEDKTFASTEGSLIHQTIYRTYPGFGCTAVANGDAQSRNYERPPLNKGYEHVNREDLLAQVDRVAEEAIAKVHAPKGPSGIRSTIILKPTNVWLTIHESVGHPTELDRVYGYEANFAGTSFATTEKLGKLQYAAPWVNFKADRTQDGGRSTLAYDDEGVPAQDWYVVKDGILVDYLTDRETAYRLGRGSSNGSAYADSWSSVPMVRIPNLGLEAGAEGGSHTATLDEMIADTEDGILIDGIGSFSIDQQRRNFQFGGDAFWKVEKGKVVGMLKDVTYHSMTTDFWNSVDAIGTSRESIQCGTNMCGKGEPMQIAQMTHRCVPVRVRNIQIGGAV